MWVALSRQAVDDGASGIAQSHHFGAFVDGLTSGIIDGLSEHLHVIIGIDPDNLSVATAHQQTKEGHGRSRGIIVAFLDEMRHDMSLQMVDINERNA